MMLLTCIVVVGILISPIIAVMILTRNDDIF